MDKESLFKAIDDCLISAISPSERLSGLSKLPGFSAYPFSLLADLEQTGQSPIHHPEGNVWIHTLLVVDEAAARRQYSADPRAFMWAALLHDIGKPRATKVRGGRITAYGHDSIGAGLARNFLGALTAEKPFIERVAGLVKYHMQILYVVRGLSFQDIPGMRKNSDIGDVALLGYCDRLGRKGTDKNAERNSVLTFLRRCGGDTDLPWLR